MQIGDCLKLNFGNSFSPQNQVTFVALSAKMDFLGKNICVCLCVCVCVFVCVSFLKTLQNGYHHNLISLLLFYGYYHNLISLFLL